MPARIVFDNVTGIGRKVSDGFRTTRLFAAFAAHYGFDFSFRNPDSGHEKGNVENKVGFIRRNLFVPTPGITNLGAYNRRLMPRCVALSDVIWQHFFGQGYERIRPASLNPAVVVAVDRWARPGGANSRKVNLETAVL